MKRARIFLACIAASGLATAGSPPTNAEFKELALKTLCQYPAPGKVVYAGDSGLLDSCLETAPAPGGQIHELRITSRGGIAADTLKIVEKYGGHLDLVIVDGLCASSCAMYILPAAKRVRVTERSYVLLHASLGVASIDRQRARIFADLRKQNPNAPDDEINQMIEWSRQKALADAPAVENFAKRTLACDDWLDPKGYPGAPLPESSAFLLVTPEMAKRCLKSARIESFWSPEAQDKFAPELGFFRAPR